MEEKGVRVAQRLAVELEELHVARDAAQEFRRLVKGAHCFGGVN